jgi:hypothetical protein
MEEAGSSAPAEPEPHLLARLATIDVRSCVFLSLLGPSAARCSRSQDRVRSFKQSLIAGARPSEAERRELLLRIDGLAAQVSFLLGAILCSGLQS